MLFSVEKTFGPLLGLISSTVISIPFL